MSTNYETITIYRASDWTDITRDEHTLERVEKLAAGRDFSELTIVADANAGPWGLLAMDVGDADDVFRTLSGADVDAGSDEYAEYTDQIADLPQYIANL